MEKLIMDTDKMKVQGEELLSVANDLSVLMNDMYPKLLKVNENNIWSSESAKGSAQQFISSVSKDRVNNYNLCKNIHKVGKEVVQYAESIASSSDGNIRG